MRTLDVKIDRGILRATTIATLGAVDLREHAAEHQRLMVFAPADVLLDDGGLAHGIFRRVLGDRGILSTSENVHVLVGEFTTAAKWLRSGCEVCIASYDNSPELLVALVLVAQGRSAPAAIAEVAKQSREFEWTADVEIPISVFAENLHAREACHERRSHRVGG